MKKKKKRPVTLIEMMIVIVIIGLIGGTLAYNMRGSLDKGKVFKTEQGGAKIYNVLMLEASQGKPVTTENWQTVIRQSPLIQNADQLIKDGWNELYTVTRNSEGDLLVSSKRYNRYSDEKEPKYFR